MMQPEVRKARVEEYGSFLYCPDRDTLCFGLYTPLGECKHEVCLLDDPKYLKEKADRDLRIQENARREAEERRKEKEEPPAPIRRQTKTPTDKLEEKIKAKEAFARKCFKENKPKLGNNVMNEVMRLQGRLRRMKGA